MDPSPRGRVLLKVPEPPNSYQAFIDVQWLTPLDIEYFPRVMCLTSTPALSIQALHFDLSTSPLVGGSPLLPEFRRTSGQVSFRAQSNHRPARAAAE